jgi:ATP/maltotriose-dependent transcriptional regulator MalT
MTDFPANVILDPISYHRAALAFARGDRAGVPALVASAEAYYRGHEWNERQKPWARMRLALLAAWSGRADEAVREGEAAMAEIMQRDVYDAAAIRGNLGTIYVALGRRDEALRCLRDWMAAPAVDSPNEIRANPWWAPLRDDPRFEEILKSAKPL